MQLQSSLAFTVLAVLPVVTQAQRVCTIQPAGCTIGTQACPTGCIKKARCTSTITQTKTTSLPASTITSTRTSTITQSQSTLRVTVTVTASTSTSPAPECATQTPFVNLFSFPDAECKNATTTDVLGIPVDTTYNGLAGEPIKFNTLTFKSAQHPNSSACAILPGGGARSVYFTIDGIPSRSPQPGCYLNLFDTTDCSGPADRVIGRGLVNECDTPDEEDVIWKSAFFDCIYA